MKYINLNLTKQSKLIFNNPGDYVVYFENLSGDLIFDIKSSGVSLNIYGLYTGSKNSIHKVNTFQNHFEPDSTSDLLIKGVFYDSARFYYRGLIRLEKKAQKSHAYQKNQNILMSKDCYVDSKPYLEILANDVFCTHGSTTGKLNQGELHYTMTRGLSKKESEELLVGGFINEIKEKLPLKYRY
ncbi:MAG: FeS assembly protein SufD [Candidatus Roizmanbacteria bacterium GW2011_GWA2_35_8]|uniref:FeS assembly protein SufD n=1 Tax=Candidatus Roizmanbacteria bacterium GW2011_GWA2_35_8 TaxID=1618479 RepID=A0A0G0FEK1_9BACT|nr:MAG: FeS assembly protein SufD [Candidatus Roizmanbacteria bacterium GW2011_GWA2_35_8]